MKVIHHLIDNLAEVNVSDKLKVCLIKAFKGGDRFTTQNTAYEAKL